MSDEMFMPWKVIDHSNEKRGGYIEIRGAHDEAICTLFPLAGKGGVGVDKARKIAQFIAAVAAVDDREECPGCDKD